MRFSLAGAMGTTPDFIPSSIFDALPAGLHRKHGTSLTGLLRFTSPMKPTTKATLLFVCLMVCALGAILSPKETAKEERDSHTQVVPVNNSHRHRGMWFRI